MVEGRRFRVLLVLLGVFLLGGCSPANREPQNAPTGGQGEPLSFTFAGVDGQPISAQQLRGRVTVLLFMTTFDVASQAQARRLQDLHRLHTPRLNAVGVVVEAPRYVDLARAFGQSLELTYSLAMADRTLLEDHPQLRLVKSVPAWIFLDEKGRIVSSAAGALTPDQLDAEATKAGR